MKRIVFCMALLLMGLILLLDLPLSGEAIPYTFTKIADTNGDFASFLDSAVSINNNGQVAFWGYLKSGDKGIFVSDGNTITPVILPPQGTITSAHEPSGINDNGTVLFQGGLATGVNGIFTYNYLSGSLTTIASSGTFSGFGGRSINNGGAVAFRAGLNIPNREGIFTGNGGSTTTIATNDGHPITAFSGDPVINEKGEVVFLGNGVFISNQSGELTNITAGMGVSEPDINDDGTVIFGGTNIQGTGLFIYKAGMIMPIVDDSGPLSGFEAFLAINNDETVVFRAFLDIGGMGIFTGPDPLADRVIATGDPLFGSTVADLFFFRAGLNDASQIAFWARLEDGTQGIYRADPITANPIPEPSTLILFSIAAVSLLVRSWRCRKQTASTTNR